jgi:hypothetical protein
MLYKPEEIYESTVGTTYQNKNYEIIIAPEFVVVRSLKSGCKVFVHSTGDVIIYKDGKQYETNFNLEKGQVKKK